jgi:four helix bundle protein
MEKLDERSFKFALRIVKLVSALPRTGTGDVMGRQVLRSGTSIGANIEEAYASTTKRDFTYKMSVALKEARETHYWLRLICEAGLVAHTRVDALLQEALEMKLILGRTVLTSKRTKSIE